MKVLITPNTFKESLDSIRVADCIAKGLKKANKQFEIVKLPFADGGTGTSEILTKTLRGKFVKLKVSGPLPNQKVLARYGIIQLKNKPKTAVIELAQAAGLKLVPPGKRNPMLTSTIGVGEMILDAINKKCTKIILGIGDSATIDCGLGALSVLGFKFLDKNNHPISLNCQGLLFLNKIQTPTLNPTLNLIIASDVTNSLTGKNGALLFAKQKGASNKVLHLIDKALKNFRNVLLKQFKKDIDKIKGSGAAGGIGGGMATLLNAKIISGFEIVKQITNLENQIKSCDLIITGEGKIDEQTLHGKTVKRIIDSAKKYKRPVICIAGSITDDAKILYKHGVIGLYSIVSLPMTLEYAIINATKLLQNISESIGRTLMTKMETEQIANSKWRSYISN